MENTCDDFKLVHLSICIIVIYDFKIVNRPVKKYAVTFIEYDGDKQEVDIEEFSKLYNKKIEGYPTIILVKDNEVIEFEAEPTLENLNEFIQSTL